MDAPAVAVSADGKTIAVGWMDMRRGQGERDTFLRIIRKGKPGPERMLGDDPAGVQGHVALGIDSDAVVHAVWESTGRILYRSSADDEDRVLSVAAERDASQPSLAVYGRRVVTAYEAKRNGSPVCVVRRVRE